MPTHEQLLELAELAAKRAATEVATVILDTVGDNITGQIVENGSMTTTYGDIFTSTIEPIGSYKGTIEGVRSTAKDFKAPDLVRVAWIGAVLDAQYRRTLPQPDDIVSFHYQKDVTPKSGMNDYHLIVAVVLNPITGKARNPVNLGVAVPTEEQLRNVNPHTGEIAPGLSPLDPASAPPGEKPFE